jgi:trans-aconitate methyltransferase
MPRHMIESVRQPKLYDELADWFHLLTAPAEYADEAALYRDTILGSSAIPVAAVLELGSGGGNNASHMKMHFSLTLVDLSPQMLEVSGELNPDCEHVQGDMRSVRLNHEFDAVFVHDAVSYITELDDLRATAETAFVHCKPGGVALFVPDHVRETFRPTTDHGGHDGDSRSLRYLMWDWDPDSADSTYVSDFAYLLRERDGSVRVEHDRHICGLFSHDEWMTVLRDAGFRPESRPTNEPEGASGSLMFIASKPTEREET